MDILHHTTIISLLEAPTDNRWESKERVATHASTMELINALREATVPLTREILCELLGLRCDPAAVPVLIGCLYDKHAGVRAEAGWSLGHIGDVTAGPDLFKRLVDPEETSGVQHTLVYAIGTVAYRPAIPHLIDLLDDLDPIIRDHAAFALAEMGVREAEGVLQDAIAKEATPLVRNNMIRALQAIQFVGAAYTDLHILQSGLTHHDAVLRAATVSTLGALASAAAGEVLQAHLLKEEDCIVRQRIQQFLPSQDAE